MVKEVFASTESPKSMDFNNHACDQPVELCQGLLSVATKLGFSKLHMKEKSGLLKIKGEGIPPPRFLN